MYCKSIDTEKWIETDAILTKLELKEIATESNIGARIRKEYSLQYEYYINNEKYVSSKYSYGEMSLVDFTEISKLKSGMAIKALYNPHDYRDSVLKPGSTLMYKFGLLILGIVVLLIALFYLAVNIFDIFLL